MNISPANRNFKVPEEYSSAILFKSNVEYHDDETGNDFVKNETYRIDTSKFNQIYQSFVSKPKPILTISTNTDSGRNLEADSYVVLEYLLPESSIPEKIEGGYYQKYMKYKRKYLSLKNNLNI
jgi:hypothetical protein